MKRCHSCGPSGPASAIDSWTIYGNSGRTHSALVPEPTSKTAGVTMARRSTGCGSGTFVPFTWSRGAKSK